MSQAVSAHDRSFGSSISSGLQLIRNKLQRSGTADGLGRQFRDVFIRTWDLGFTAFGGPPVHFQIFHKRLVEKYKWSDEQTWQDLFAICQSLPGPGSTKMGFCLTLIHAGFLPALTFFIIWSLPGAVGMFLLAHGVSRVTTSLPPAVYALLSGSNAATVGIIAQAAIQLSQNAITDGMTRCILIFAACAGLIYNALWYFPALLIFSAILSFSWDFGGRKLLYKLKTRFTRAFTAPAQSERVEHGQEDIELSPVASDPTHLTTATLNERHVFTNQDEAAAVENNLNTPSQSAGATDEAIRPRSQTSISLRVGVLVVIGFFVSFAAIVGTRSALDYPPVSFKLFSNMYLAGTIIFGGGPVVIPLLREYIVTEGWVSSRDFLIGLAVIQAFPGPNFNFAVYLAALSSRSAQSPAIVTALLGFIGIFFPGLTLAVGFSPIWYRLRRYHAVTSVLRGINASAVGLVWTAVYRLWEIGYLKVDATSGISLGLDPWWVVVAVVSFSINRWVNWPAPISILLGASMGIAWWGIIEH